jgi:hypothetical protein
MRLVTIVLLLSFFLINTELYSQDRLKPVNLRDLDSLAAINKLKRIGTKNTQSQYLSGKKPLENYFRTVIPNRNASATSKICFDTSERFFIQNDTITYYTRSPYKTKDGNLLLVGEYATYSASAGLHSGGSLMKVDEKGNIIWSRLYDSSATKTPWYLYYYRVIELADGSIVMAGGINNNIADNDDFIVTKTNSVGQITWSKTYTSRFWGRGHGSADYFRMQQIKQDPSTGDIYICGTFWVSGKGLLKINNNNGSLIWGRSYQISQSTVFDEAIGIDIRSNDIVYFGRSLGYPRTLINSIRINKFSGDTLQTKFYQSADTSGINVDILSPEILQVLSNGHYIISGCNYGYFIYNWDGKTAFYQASVIEFDTSLNFVKAFSFRNAIQSNSYNTKVTIYPDGSGLFSMLENFSGYTANVYYVHFNKDGSIIKQRRKHYNGEGMPWENNFIKTKDGGDLIVKLLGDSATNINKIEFLKLHPSDTSSFCLGEDDNRTFTQPFNVISLQTSIDSARENAFQESVNQTLTVIDNQLEKKSACFQVSYCDTLEIIPSDTILCFGQPLTVTVRKNKACGAIVPLFFDSAAVNSVTQLNDSTFTFSFRKPWAGNIGGSLQGCTLMKDSFYIKIMQSPGPVSLGSDSSLCPSNTIQLNARSGYSSYKWQDGTTDSTFLVSQPGIYHVTVKDACNNIFKDTVLFIAAPPVALNIGADKTKCNNDTLHLNAPSGFLNYSWGPNYNLNSTNSQNVIINPAKDTIYYVKAEKTPGCFGFDTINIKVHFSPVINLGNDTSFCNGDSIILNSGSGFSNYQWSNGNSTQKINIKSKGVYSVKSTTIQGCISTDTIKVINVFTNPIVQLNKDTGLCIGTTKTLDAGNFSSYLWNNGSR